jgi:hypothetical protein
VFNVLIGDDQKAAIDLKIVQVQQPAAPRPPEGTPPAGR